MKKVKIFLIVASFIGVFVSFGTAEELKWEDIDYSSGPLAGHSKFIWAKSGEIQKAAYLELFYKAIQYCTKNKGKSPKELDLSKSGPYVVNYYKITPEVIGMYYRFYGDYGKAAKIAFKDWTDSNHNPELGSAEESGEGYVMGNYEDAGMYKELANFYSQVYPDEMKWLALSTDIKLIDSDFKTYQENWPKQAENYQEFMSGWAKAKKLAKTAKPKPLDPAVQNHEWFYSDKREEVLKALKYYYTNKVEFMLKKALKHKDPVVAAKAKEYLAGLAKGAGDETKH